MTVARILLFAGAVTAAAAGGTVAIDIANSLVHVPVPVHVAPMAMGSPPMLKLSQQRPVGVATAPNTSLATIPAAYFGGHHSFCNSTTGCRSKTNLQMLAKMRMVMVGARFGPKLQLQASSALGTSTRSKP